MTPRIFSARRRPDRFHYQIVKCTHCGLVRSNPILPLSRIAQLYRKSDLPYTSEIPNLQKTYGRYLKEILPLVPNKQRLLEIGCGNGFFLETALHLGFKKVFGVEPSQEAVRSAKPHSRLYIKNAFFEKRLFPKNYFDLICCFHTLDHVPDPNHFIKDTYHILKPDGVEFFITHNVSSILAKLFGSECPIIDIEHIYLFNPETLSRLFRKNNFQVIKTVSIHNSYSLKYFLTMAPLPQPWLKSTLIKLPLLNFSLTLPLGNLGIVVHKQS